MIINSDFPEEKGLGLGFGLLLYPANWPVPQAQGRITGRHGSWIQSPEPVRFKSHVCFSCVSMAFTWPASVSLCLFIYSFIYSLTTLNEVSLYCPPWPRTLGSPELALAISLRTIGLQAGITTPCSVLLPLKRNPPGFDVAAVLGKQRQAA